MKADRNRAERIIDYVSFRQESFNETVGRNQLEDAFGSDLSNELNYLKDSGVIRFEKQPENSSIVLSEGYEEGLEEIPASTWNEEELIDGGFVFDSPKLYVAALQPFGNSLHMGSEPVLSQDEIERHVGEELDFELATLTEWDYFTEIEPSHEEIRSVDSAMYRLKIEDNEVRADAFHSNKHVEECYDGSIEMFLRKYSEADSEALSKRGVNFYRNM